MKTSTVPRRHRSPRTPPRRHEDGLLHPRPGVRARRPRAVRHQQRDRARPLHVWPLLGWGVGLAIHGIVTFAGLSARACAGACSHRRSRACATGPERPQQGNLEDPQEERIFLLLDLVGSTTLAERIVHLRYYSFLRDFIEDLERPVLEHGGDVYQYVGDEVVVTWPLADLRSNARCIACHFAIVDAVERARGRYERTSVRRPVPHRHPLRARRGG